MSGYFEIYNVSIMVTHVLILTFLNPVAKPSTQLMNLYWKILESMRRNKPIKVWNQGRDGIYRKDTNFRVGKFLRFGGNGVNRDL